MTDEKTTPKITFSISPYDKDTIRYVNDLLLAQEKNMELRSTLWEVCSRARAALKHGEGEDDLIKTLEEIKSMTYSDD